MFTFVPRLSSGFNVSTLNTSHAPGNVLTFTRYSLYGVTSVQTVAYYRQNHGDPKAMKYLVSVQTFPALHPRRDLIVHFGRGVGWISLVSSTVYCEVGASLK